MNNGLYEFPGSFPTASADACETLLLLPITKVSKVYLGLRVNLLDSISALFASESFL